MVSINDVYQVLTLQWQSGQEIKAKVNKEKTIKASSVAVYAQLAELVDKELAEQRIVPITIGQHTVKRFDYKLTEQGYKKRSEEPGTELNSEGLEFAF